MKHLAAAILLACGLAALPARAQMERDQSALTAVQNLEAYAVYKMGQYDLARQRWEALAAKGSTTAMINLANIHAQGQGVPRDPATALSWTRKAAELGDARAQYELGLAYRTGAGVAPDPAQAEAWLSRAADQRNAEARAALGVGSGFK